MLLEQINKEITESEVASLVIQESYKQISEKTELLKGITLNMLAESAVSVLAKLVHEAESGEFEDFDTAVDFITVLDLMSDPDHREAFGDILTTRVFNVIVKQLGEEEYINNYCKKLARYGSVLPARKRMKALLTLVSDPNERERVVSLLRKLRMAYERIQIDSFRKRNPSLESGNTYDV